LKERTTVEQFERVRRDARDGGLSIRALADRHEVHRGTVRCVHLFVGDGLNPTTHDVVNPRLDL
jgi:hypothetical protein